MSDAGFEKWWHSRECTQAMRAEDAKVFGRAAYEAGEIAMREKVAQALESRPYYSNQTPDAIRALPLSGAEEAKKEKA